MSYLLLDLFFGDNFLEIGVEARKDPKMKWINSKYIQNINYNTIFFIKFFFHYLFSFTSFSAFVKMINVCLLCLAFYPMFVCIRLHKVILANIIGIVNMAFWLVIRVEELYYCTPRGSGYYVRSPIYKNPINYLIFLLFDCFFFQ